MKKDFDVKTWLYPMPVLMIATYNEDGSPPRSRGRSRSGWSDVKKSLRVGVVAVGVAAVLYVGLSVGAAMNGRSVVDLYELGKRAVEARVSRHTVADRVAAIVAKKPQLAVREGVKMKVWFRQMWFKQC